MTTVVNGTGSLDVIGTGFTAGQTTLEAQATIRQADKVLYLVTNPAIARFIEQLNPTAESLHHFYATGKPRLDTYLEMTERILAPVREGRWVCAAFYGHPGVFVDPGHRAVRIARSEGFAARMLPGVSAEDYLFADLGVDPSRYGCASYEATDFLIRGRIFDPTSVLILWQVGAIGDLTFRAKSDIRAGLRLLLDRLIPTYGADHVVTIYEGTIFPVCASRMEQVPLGKLPEVDLTMISTLYVPPNAVAAPDLRVVRELGLDRSGA